MPEVARFDDGADAEIVAAFLNDHGVPAKAVLSQPPMSSFGQRGPYIEGRVVVSRSSEQAAYALFNRVRRGEFKADSRCKAINRLVLGSPSNERDWPTLPKATPFVIAGRVIMAIFVVPFVLVVMAQCVSKG